MRDWGQAMITVSCPQALGYKQEPPSLAKWTDPRLLKVGTSDSSKKASNLDLPVKSSGLSVLASILEI